MIHALFYVPFKKNLYKYIYKVELCLYKKEAYAPYSLTEKQFRTVNKSQCKYIVSLKYCKVHLLEIHSIAEILPIRRQTINNVL